MDARTRNEVRPGRGFSLVEDDPDQIKSNIDRTRAHLDETVTEISTRLSPRHLVTQFTDMFAGRKGPGGASSSEVLHAIRDNPIPAALIGAGVTWFLVNSRKSSGSSSGRETGGHGDRDWLAPGATYDTRSSTETHTGGRFRERAGDAMEAGRERIEKTGRGVRHLAEEAGSSIGHAAKEVGSRISHTASAARERFSGGEGLHMRERASEATRNVRDVIEEHPLIIGAAALAIGLIGGLSAPPTRTERRVMGPVRDEMMDNIKTKAKEDVVPQVKEAAREIAREAGDAASSKMGDDDKPLGERLSSAASAGIHAGAEAIREKTREQGDRQSIGRESGGDQTRGDSTRPGPQPGQGRQPGEGDTPGRGFGPGPAI